MAEPNGASIEALFRPSTRFRDANGNQTHNLPEGFTEIELLPGLSLEDVRATRLTWNAFHSFAGEKLVWMTPDLFVYAEYLESYYPLVLALGGTTGMSVYVTSAAAAAVATATCNFLLRLLATCETDGVCICDDHTQVPHCPLSGAALSLFFQESRDSLQKVTLNGMVLSEDLCLALGTMSRLDVELDVSVCCLADDAADAFVECLQSDRGPVDLNWCRIDSQILANALTGDSRVTRLKPHFHGTDDAEKAVLFRALTNNRGLVHLDLRGDPISDENWIILCQSLQAHPSLTSLKLSVTMPRSPDGVPIIFSDEQKASRTSVLVEMMQQNTVLHTIELLASERNNQIYTEELRPYLVTNLYRPRVHAIKKTKDRPFRKKVLGRAVYSARSNPNLVWMLLLENVDAFVRSEEKETNSEVPVAVAAAAVVLAVAVAGSKRKR
jgi:hypothetical protein